MAYVIEVILTTPGWLVGVTENASCVIGETALAQLEGSRETCMYVFMVHVFMVHIPKQTCHLKSFSKSKSKSVNIMVTCSVVSQYIYTVCTLIIPLLFCKWQYMVFDMDHIKSIFCLDILKLSLFQNFLLGFIFISEYLICGCSGIRSIGIGHVCSTFTTYISVGGSTAHSTGLLLVYGQLCVLYTNQLDNSTQGWSRDACM